MASLLTDLSITTLSTIVPLYPLNAVTTFGILSTWFGVSSHFCFVFSGGCSHLENVTLLLCFFKKHQAIATIIDVHVVPKFLGFACYLLVLVLASIPLVGLSLLSVSRDEQLIYINMVSL